MYESCLRHYSPSRVQLVRQDLRSNEKLSPQGVSVLWISAQQGD